nr:hypothetical protein [Planctomycetota bacterium]
MIVPLLALALAAPQDPPPVTEAEFVDWVAGAAIHVPSLDWREPGAIDFSFLDQALEGKRVVSLGETDHWVAQRMEFRLLLIQEQRQRGFHRIGMAMGLSDGKRRDHSLESGDGRWLDRGAPCGRGGGVRPDRQARGRG